MSGDTFVPNLSALFFNTSTDAVVCKISRKYLSKTKSSEMVELIIHIKDF